VKPRSCARASGMPGVAVDDLRVKESRRDIHAAMRPPAAPFPRPHLVDVEPIRSRWTFDVWRECAPNRRHQIVQTNRLLDAPRSANPFRGRSRVVGSRDADNRDVRNCLILTLPLAETVAIHDRHHQIQQVRYTQMFPFIAPDAAGTIQMRTQC
jgi:hypothetical protein